MAARGVSVRGSGDTRTPHKPEGILVAFLFLYWFGMVSLSPYCVGMSFWVTVSMRFVYKPSRLMTTFLSLCQCTSLQQESCTYCRILTAALCFFPPYRSHRGMGNCCNCYDQIVQLLWKMIDFVMSSRNWVVYQHYDRCPVTSDHLLGLLIVLGLV